MMSEPTSLALIVKVAEARVFIMGLLMAVILVAVIFVPVILVPMVLVPMILVVSVIFMAAAMAVVAKVVTTLLKGADAVSVTVQGDTGEGNTQEPDEEEEPCEIHARRRFTMTMGRLMKEEYEDQRRERKARFGWEESGVK